MDFKQWKWTRQPANYTIYDDKIEIITKPHTDLWQRTYYHFQNDNAPVFQMETDEKYFSFVVKTEFNESHHRFDQCGIVMYLDSENWQIMVILIGQPPLSMLQSKQCGIVLVVVRMIIESNALAMVLIISK